MARYAYTRINDHRDRGLLDNNFQHRFGFQSLIGANWRAERHHRRAARFFQTFAQHRIGAAVGQHHEAFPYQNFRRFQRFNRVGEQPAGVRVNFQFQPVSTQRFPRQTGGKDRFFRRFGAGGVGQQANASRQQRREDRVIMLTKIDALHRQRYQLAAGGANGLHHDVGGSEFTGAGEKMGLKRFIRNT